MRLDAPATSRSETRPRSSHPPPIPSRSAHLRVRTGVPAHSPVASAGARNQVNWNSFPCRKFLRKDARRDARMHSVLPGGAKWIGQQSTKRSTFWFISARNPAGPIVHTHWSKVLSKADVEATTFTDCWPENCSAPKMLPGREARYIAEVSWGPRKQRTFQLPIWV